MLLVAKLMTKLCLKQRTIKYAEKFLRVYDGPFPEECQCSEENKEKMKYLLEGMKQHDFVNVDVIFNDDEILFES